MKTMFTKFNLIICSFSVLLFTACEQKTTTVTDEEVVTVTDTNTTTTTYEVERDGEVEREGELERKIEAENAELKTRIERLKEKAKVKGKTAGAEIERAIDNLERERVEFQLDSTDNKIDQKWEKLKSKISAAADSIDRKF